ncbi:MAG: ACP S-malonyltransferase [Gammaproteobacteria bacterium]|nr:ACP S-malonyltransferase [Gammaproteobacteria bacterium]
MSLGIVFPGQGSQSVGMLTDIAAEFPSIQAHFEEAGESIDEPLWQIVREGPEELLARTEVTQPALLTAAVALWALWESKGGQAPSILAGHSLGEYSALVCAGSIEFIDAVRLVNQRGKFMTEAVPRGEGAMAAILGLDEADVVTCCSEVSGIVSPANFNAPGQIVIAGTAEAVQIAVENCQNAGARRAVLLNVSGPFHCALMKPAEKDFAAVLGEVKIRMPSIPVVHNVDGKVAVDEEDVRNKLIAQLAQPVQWIKCVTTMMNEGVDSVVECGPGKVLAGLFKRIDRSVPVANLGTLDGVNQALSSQIRINL